jgi:YbgC/YbaW family acyl-CoA thioester hydrolase
MPDRKPFRFQTRIRFVDTDASGRIHFTAMFRYFEAAEIEFLRTLGITYDMRDGYDLPRVHVECDFVRGLSHDDLIEIEVALAKLGRSSVRFEFQAFKAGELAARGVIVAVCTDRRTMRSVPIPDVLRAKLIPALSEHH